MSYEIMEGKNFKKHKICCSIMHNNQLPKMWCGKQGTNFVTANTHTIAKGEISLKTSPKSAVIWFLARYLYGHKHVWLWSIATVLQNLAVKVWRWLPRCLNFFWHTLKICEYNQSFIIRPGRRTYSMKRFWRPLKTPTDSTAISFSLKDLFSYQSS